MHPKTLLTKSLVKVMVLKYICLILGLQKINVEKHKRFSENENKMKNIYNRTGN